MTTTLSRILMALAAVFMALATGLGAYASHGLDAVLDAAALATFKTAVDYQFFHSLGLIGVCLYGERRPASRVLALAAGVMAAGIVLFCGGVYASSLDGPGWLSGLAPVGGVGLIGSWCLVAVAVIGKPPEA
jgi:uncharacterized membrane protein YgdD (TMEM256/DUF423 family)